MGSGDGWTSCALGHRHWGRFGAAGLLIADENRVVLQHRAPWTHEGGRWGVPGGARDRHESAVEAALREAWEEGGVEATDVAVSAIYVADHGGWSYSTVVVSPVRNLSPRALNAESVSIEWVAHDQVEHLPLHAGFALAWPYLRRVLAPLVLIAGPGVGQDDLTELAVHGFVPRHDHSAVSPARAIGTLARVFPRIVRVTDEIEADSQRRRYPAGASVVLSTADDLKIWLATGGTDPRFGRPAHPTSDGSQAC